MTPPRWHLPVLLALAALVHGWILTHTEVAARDSVGFIRYAVQFDDPPPGKTRLDIVREAQHPPGYPLAVWALSKPVTAAFGTSPETLVWAAQGVSCLAALLMVIPLYRLGTRLAGPTAALAGTAAFQTLPVPAQVTADGLSDGLYLLGVALGLAAAARGFGTGRACPFLTAGACGGLAFLTRLEGLMLPAAVGVALVGACLTRSLTVRATFARLLLLTLGTIAVGGPYVALIGKLTNKPSGDVMFRQLQGEDARPEWHMVPTTRVAATAQPLAAWWTGGDERSYARTAWAAGATVKEWAKSAHYGVFALGVVGALLALRRVRHGATLTVLTLGAGNLAVVLFLGSRIGYVSERHTLLLTLILAILSGPAVVLIAGRLARLGRTPEAWAYALTAVLVIVGLPGCLKRLHANREPHRQAGLWLAANARPDEVIFDSFCWAEYYAGRVFTGGRVTHTDKSPVYVVVEPANRTPHSRLPAYARAQEMCKAGTRVFQWPADAAPEAARVAVYRVVP